MHISITNHSHLDTKFYIIDTSPALNVPQIPKGFTLVFREKYTSNLEVITIDKLNKIFEDNKLFFNIKLFNNIFRIDDVEFKLFLKGILKDVINQYIMVKNNKLIMPDYLVNFIKCDDIHSKSDIDDIFNDLNNKLLLTEEKISSISKVAKKKEIETELIELENQINSLIS